jgi:cytochrome bd-type quinol oxidase subunit 2
MKPIEFIDTLHKFIQLPKDLAWLIGIIVVAISGGSWFTTGGIENWWIQYPFLLLIPVVGFFLLILIFLILTIVERK